MILLYHTNSNSASAGAHFSPLQPTFSTKIEVFHIFLLVYTFLFGVHNSLTEILQQWSQLLKYRCHGAWRGPLSIDLHCLFFAQYWILLLISVLGFFFLLLFYSGLTMEVLASYHIIIKRTPPTITSSTYTLFESLLSRAAEKSLSFVLKAWSSKVLGIFSDLASPVWKVHSRNSFSKAVQYDKTNLLSCHQNIFG